MPGASGQKYVGQNFEPVKSSTRGCDVSTAELAAAIVQAMTMIGGLPQHQVRDMAVARALEDILEELKQLNSNITKALGH